MPMRKKIGVTGLSGMVGQRWQELYGENYSLVPIDLSRGIDITQKELVDQALGEDQLSAVVHLAAFTNVSAAWEQNGDLSGSCYQVNVVGTQNVIEACARRKLYLIHISTDFVFDGEKEGKYTEADTPHPIEWYGMTKYLAEQLVEKGGIKSVILRIAYPYQAKPNRPDWLQNLKTKLLAGNEINQFTDHYITPTLADDIAQVIDYCLSQQPSGLYHAVGSSYHSDYELAQKVAQAMASKTPIMPGKLSDYLKTINRPYQRNLRTSNEKLERDFHIKMKSVDEGLVLALTGTPGFNPSVIA